MSSPSLTSISVRFRGVRGSVPSPGPYTTRYGGNTSCLEIRAGDEILILDAGSGIRALGADLLGEFGPRPITATILISHTHWDHIQGLPFFAPAFAENNRIRIAAAKGAGATLHRALSNQLDPIHFPVGLEQMGGLQGIEEFHSDNVAFAEFNMQVTQLNHPGGCAGFRIEAEGGSLAYFPDHEPFDNEQSSSALVDFLRGIDLLVLDTQYTAAEYRHRHGWGHGSLPESVSLAVNAGVARLALFHHDPSHDDAQLDAMVRAAKSLAAASGLIVTGARENETIKLQRELEEPSRRERFRNLVNTAAA